MQFVLIDQSQGATVGSGESLTPDALDRAARLLTVFCDAYVGLFWPTVGACVWRVGSSPSDVRPNEVAANVRATLPDAPGAIAYHTVNGVAVPDIEDGLSLSDSLFGASNGWLSAMSHEAAETIGDPGTNILCSDGNGKLWARELSDAVESQSWELTLPDGTSGYCSNFLLPSFFVPGGQPPYDYMSLKGLPGAIAPSAPFAVVSGGYEIWELDPQNEQQVTGVAGLKKMGRVYVDGSPSRRLEKKRHPWSRCYRRGVRL